MRKVEDIFIEMIKIDSESGSEKRFVDYLKDEFGKLGLECIKDIASIEKTGSDAPNLIVKLKGQKTDKTCIGFSAHVDTVVPGKDIKPILDGDVIKSSGNTILGSDDKSGIAAILHAAMRIKEENIPSRDAMFIFTTSEEVGLLGAKHLDTSLIEGLENMIVLDSGGPFGEIITSAPSQNSIKMKVKGKAAHAGLEPEKGLNAIFAVSKGIANTKIGRIDDETTSNIGTIRGGKATNIVPDLVEFEGEVRSRDDNKLKKVTEEMISSIQKEVKECGCEFEYEVIPEYKAYNIPNDHELVKEIINVGKKMGVDIKTGSTGGGSDTNIHCENGINAVNMSTGMMNVHTTSEHIHIEDLKKTSEFIFNILTN